MSADLPSRHEVLRENTQHALAIVRNILRYDTKMDKIDRENLSEAAARLDAALLTERVLCRSNPMSRVAA